MDGVSPPDAPAPANPSLPYEPPPAPAPRSPRARRALIAVTVAWGLLLAGPGIWYSLHGRPAARGQTTLARAQPLATQASEGVGRAAGPSGGPAGAGLTP